MNVNDSKIGILWGTVSVANALWVMLVIKYGVLQIGEAFGSLTDAGIDLGEFKRDLPTRFCIFIKIGEYSNMVASLFWASLILLFYWIAFRPRRWNIWVLIYSVACLVFGLFVLVVYYSFAIESSMMTEMK